MKIIYAVRTSLFYAVYAPIIFVFGTFSCTVGLLMPYAWRQEIVAFGNLLVVRWFGIACGVRLRVIGRENLPKGRYVALSKHQSTWETYYLQRLLRPVSTILKRELLRIPVFGWGLATMRPIAIDRSNPREALKQVMAQGLMRIGQGSNVVIYPEGTRIAPGQVGNYGRSGAALAVAAEVPVVPIAHNAGNCWPGKRFLKFPGTITVVIGEPIDTKNRHSKELTIEVQDWIESRQREIG